MTETNEGKRMTETNNGKRMTESPESRRNFSGKTDAVGFRKKVLYHAGYFLCLCQLLMRKTRKGKKE